MKKYIIYLLLVIILILFLFYMSDHISLWFSLMGTQILIIVVAFIAGWILGRWQR
jgi:hypothetical protein